MKLRLSALILVAAAAALLPPAARAQATDPPYLSQMPTASRVKAEVRGADALDTSARQAAAFWHLMWVVRDLNGPRNVSRQLTPDAQRLVNTYHSNFMWYSLKENAPPPQDAQRWYKLRESYENDLGFLDELLRQLFPPEFRAGYYRATGKQPSARPKSAQPSAADNRPRPRAAAAPDAGEVFDAETLSELGYLNLREGDYELALNAFKRALALNPSFRDAHFGLAHVYDKQGQYQLAVSAFERGLALQPADPEHDANMLILLGLAYHKLKQYQEALGAYRRAVGLTPKAKALPAAHKAMGDAYYALGQYPDALAAFRQALSVDPNYPAAHHGLGFTYLVMGRKAEAQQVYRRLLSLDEAAAEQLLEGINKAP